MSAAKKKGKPKPTTQADALFGMEEMRDVDREVVQRMPPAPPPAPLPKVKAKQSDQQELPVPAMPLPPEIVKAVEPAFEGTEVFLEVLVDYAPSIAKPDGPGSLVWAFGGMAMEPGGCLVADTIERGKLDEVTMMAAGASVVLMALRWADAQGIPEPMRCIVRTQDVRTIGVLRVTMRDILRAGKTETEAYINLWKPLNDLVEKLHVQFKWEPPSHTSVSLN
jgi:hypothetical protein